MHCPNAQAINEDIRMHRPHYLPLLEYTTTDWPPGRLFVAEHNLLGPVVQFSIHLIVDFSTLYFTTLSMKMLLETVWKALLESR